MVVPTEAISDITIQDYEKWKCEPGHEREAEIMGILETKLGVEKVEYEEVGKDYGDKICFAEAPADVDFMEGFDLVIHVPNKTVKPEERWVEIDVTTNTGLNRAARKKQRWAEEKGKEVVKVPAGVVEKAHRGGRKYIREIYDAFIDVLEPYAIPIQ